MISNLSNSESLPEKIKTFETIQDQFNELKRNQNLRTINHAWLSKYDYSKQLNGQLAPVNRSLSSVLNDQLKHKTNLTNLTNLLIKMDDSHTMNPFLLDDKFYRHKSSDDDHDQSNRTNGGKLVKRGELENPSLVRVDDYIFNIVNLHKQNHQSND